MHLLLLPLFFTVFFSCKPRNTGDPGFKNPELTSGKTVYLQHCALCHGVNGDAAVAGATNLTKSSLSREETIKVIISGSDNRMMRGFEGSISPQELEVLLEYIHTFKGN